MSVEVPESTVTQYRTISPLAILALLVSLGSPLALMNPLLAVIALVGMFLALYALRQIALSPELLSGRGFALVALVLCVFVLAYLPTRMLTRQKQLATYAQQMGDAFLVQMQAGNMHEAHHISNLRFPVFDPSKPPASPKDKLNDDDFAGFMKIEGIEKLVALKRQYTFHFDGLEPSAGAQDYDVLVLRYEIVPQGDTNQKPFFLWITTSRAHEQESKLPRWVFQTISHVRPAK